MNQNILNFLSERKETWLKDKLKKAENTEEQNQLHQEASEKFELARWLPDAAKRAGWLTMTSHPSKFSHPGAKTSSVIAERCESSNDGLLRSGNVQYELDVFGSAGAMDVYKFLNTFMEDGKTVMAHLEEDTLIIKQLFALPNLTYKELKAQMMSIKESDSLVKTDRFVKQVYFPTDANYHLLSILTPSGLLTQMLERINALHFSEITKQNRQARKSNEYNEGYSEIWNLTVIGFGGTQPQNVSVLNSRNAGRAYLLPSFPPKLKQREVKLPKSDFFKNSLVIKHFKESFEELDRLIKIDVNNIAVRTNIKNSIRSIIYEVLQRVFKLRSQGMGWSKNQYYSSLPLAQRIWLDDAYIKERKDQEDWLNEVVSDFGRWIIGTYSSFFEKKYNKLSDHEFSAIKEMIKESLEDDQEFFK